MYSYSTVIWQAQRWLTDWKDKKMGKMEGQVPKGNRTAWQKEKEKSSLLCIFSCVLKNKYQEQQRSKKYGTNAVSSHSISNCHDMGTYEIRPNKGKEPSGSKERTHTTWLNCEKHNKLKSKPIKFVIEVLWLQKGSGIDILFILETFLKFVLLLVMKTTTFSL